MVKLSDIEVVSPLSKIKFSDLHFKFNQRGISELKIDNLKKTKKKKIQSQ